MNNSQISSIPTDDDATTASNNILTVYGSIDRLKNTTELCLANGEVLLVPTAALFTRPRDGIQVEKTASEEATVIPVIEEHLDVSRRVVSTGTVKLEKQVHEYQETLNETLAVRSYDVHRVPMDRIVETVPAPRQEGNTTVYPVIEERMVLTKQLVLIEEVHVTRQDTEKVDTQVVTLKRESITVKRETALNVDGQTNR